MPVPEDTLNVVAPDEVPQTKPLDVTVAPPSDEIVPPPVAEVPVIDVTVAVAETVGVVKVVNVIFGP